jgi:hypothetical protein
MKTSQVQYITPPYAAQIARVIGSVAGSLARAPSAPENFTATGNSVEGIRIKFDGSENGRADHYVVVARSVDENFYRQRVSVSNHGDDQVISAQTLVINSGDSFYVSVIAVDERGHESLAAYPEVRCDYAICGIPTYAYNVTAPLPPPPPTKDPAEDD